MTRIPLTLAALALLSGTPALAGANDIPTTVPASVDDLMDMVSSLRATADKVYEIATDGEFVCDDHPERCGDEARLQSAPPDPLVTFAERFLEEAPHIAAVLTAAGEDDDILANPGLSGNGEDVMAGLVGEAERALAPDESAEDILIHIQEDSDRNGVDLARLCRLFTTFTVAGRQYDCERDEANNWTTKED